MLRLEVLLAEAAAELNELSLAAANGRRLH